jgi:Fe2+ or Zn2+ uptake regulation protein
MSIRCLLGIHDLFVKHSSRYEEDSSGHNILVEDRDVFYCRRCGKIIYDFHYKDWEKRPYAWKDGKLL